MPLKVGNSIVQKYIFDCGKKHVVTKYSFNNKPVWTSGDYDENVTPAEYFTFAPLGDGTFSIKAKNVADMPAEVILPSMYNGKPVTKVAEYAFIGANASERCTTMTSVVIPDGITSIGEGAFVYCTNLTSVTLGSNLTSIDDGAFIGCDSLTSIVIPYSVTFVGYQAFTECPNLTVYCEASSQPSGWDVFWNINNEIPVVWGYTG